MLFFVGKLQERIDMEQKKERTIYRSFGLSESQMNFIEQEAKKQNKKSVNDIIRDAVALYRQHLEK